MKSTALTIFFFGIFFLAVFKIVELSFWLMGQKSTLLNISGLFMLVASCVGTAFFIIKKFKKQ